MKKYKMIAKQAEATQWFKHGDHPDVKKFPEDSVGEDEGSGLFESPDGEHKVVFIGDWVVFVPSECRYEVKSDAEFKADYEAV